MPSPALHRSALLIPLFALWLGGCNDPGDTDADTDRIAERAEQTQPTSASLTEHYTHTLDQTLTAIEQDNQDLAESLARDLVDQSLPLLDSVALRYTDCAAYFQALRELPNLLPSLDEQAVRTGYLHGQALPEGNPRCHDAAGLMIAPAMAMVVARDQPDDWQQVMREHLQTAGTRLDRQRDVLEVDQEAAPEPAPR